MSICNLVDVFGETREIKSRRTFGTGSSVLNSIGSDVEAAACIVDPQLKFK